MRCWLYLSFFVLASQITVATQASAPRFESAAPIAYLIDLNSGRVLLDKGSDRKVPTASMAKMMTAFVAFEAIKAGKLSADDSFTVRPETWSAWNNRGSTMFLRAKQEVSARNLLHGILTLSGNDASVVLAEAMNGNEQDFAARMNAEARRIGMENSHFGNSNGWPDGGRTVSTARDLALLAERIIEDHPLLFSEYFAQRSFTWNGVTQTNRNPLLGAIAGADGMKTGHSKSAGYCLAGTAKQGNRRLVMVIAGLPSAQARIEEARRLMRWGFENWQERPLFDANQPVSKLPVQLGDKLTVQAVTTQRVGGLATGAGAENWQLTVRYDGPLRAPIRKGQRIATLVVDDGTHPQNFPLVAAETIERTGFLGRAWNGLRLAMSKL